MPFTFEKNADEIRITGYDGAISHLRIPEEVVGLPVRTIAKSAFSHRNDLVFAELPASLRRLERFAFYSCTNLKQVVLHDGITDYYDGIFRLCGSLREVEMDLTGGRTVVLKELLADHDRALRFLLHLPRGDARLVFPEYLEEYVEDTRARAIHSNIVGTGYAYRECVSKSGIDFREYDRIFDRTRRLDPALAGEIALERLLFPLDLGRTARDIYESFLRDHSVDVICQVLSEQREDWLRLMKDHRLITPEAREIGIRTASESGLTTYVSLLMQGAPRPAGGGRMKL